MLPLNQLAKGIDVSHHRGSIDWPKVKQSGITFGIVKCTDGTSFIDHKFDINWTGMRRARIIRGAYHFFRPGSDPKSQADHYLRMVGNIIHEEDLPPVLDFEAYPLSVREAFESLTLEERFRRAKIWLKTVEYATGKVPIIYTNISTWKYFMGNTTEFSRHPLWIANYEVNSPNVPANNWDGKGWTIWQMKDTAKVPGVNGGEPPVDLNVYKDSVQNLMSWVGYTGTRALPPMVLNHEMMEAMIRAAHITRQNPNVFIEKARLTYIGSPTENLTRPYDGPAIPDLPITEIQKTALLVALEELADGVSATWENITNQDIINAFYSISPLFGTPGWDLIELAQLEYLIYDREAIYTGPRINDLPGITDEHKTALLVELGLQDSAPVETTDPVEETVVVEEPEIEGPVIEESTVNEEPVVDDTGEIIDESVPETEPEQTTEEKQPAYPSLTNQEMINAFYQGGNNLGIPGWTLVERANLTNIAEVREDAYSGLPITDIDSLNRNEQARVLEALGDDLSGLQMALPYPGLLNQDIINLFYRSASKNGEDGWLWAIQVGLEYIAETRLMRYEPYRGPYFEDFMGLNIEQLSLLQIELADMVTA